MEPLAYEVCKSATEPAGENAAYGRCDTVGSERKPSFQKEMATILGVGAQSLTKLENGELPPWLRADVIFHIYDRFGILPQALVSQLFGDGANGL